MVKTGLMSRKYFKSNILNNFDGVVISPGPGRPDKVEVYYILLRILGYVWIY
jgi:anthranilate/para-aminobenzoate synthase component II